MQLMKISIAFQVKNANIKIQTFALQLSSNNSAGFVNEHEYKLIFPHHQHQLIKKNYNP
ncbi:hypothetical protein LX69_00601 [Breznakibacter xylanolyticus]|uniref:Uncharacterized protein n=1 Tax=Breznakibacter xylanolyticus TaxID=990 RepID=A0A2W7NI80_9BACT|nr:hypothetical protein LX69_00601 [Breznakibacter xylanolyticus]